MGWLRHYQYQPTLMLDQTYCGDCVWSAPTNYIEENYLLYLDATLIYSGRFMHNNDSRVGCIMMAAKVILNSNSTGQKSRVFSLIFWTQHRGPPLGVAGTAPRRSRGPKQPPRVSPRWGTLSSPHQTGAVRHTVFMKSAAIDCSSLVSFWHKISLYCSPLLGIILRLCGHSGRRKFQRLGAALLANLSRYSYVPIS